VLAYDLNLALTEAVVNAIQHAGPTGSDPKVRVHIELADEDLRIAVWDPGHRFDLEALPPANLDALLECGRGLFLIRSLMDSVSSYDTADGHTLEMKKRLGYSPEVTGDGLRRAD